MQAWIVRGLVLACALLAAAGCQQPTPSAATPPANYAPYDVEANPFCGALGNCQPTNPIRYNWERDGHGG